MYMYTITGISHPPMNRTVCRGSDVTINCGYNWVISNITWIINGTSFNNSTIMDNPSFQQNNHNEPSSYSLEVYSINGTTTFQCIVHSNPNVTSTEGIVTVIGMWVYFVLYTYE